MGGSFQIVGKPSMCPYFRCVYQRAIMSVAAFPNCRDFSQKLLVLMTPAPLPGGRRGGGQGADLDGMGGVFRSRDDPRNFSSTQWDGPEGCTHAWRKVSPEPRVPGSKLSGCNETCGHTDSSENTKCRLKQAKTALPSAALVSSSRACVALRNRDKRRHTGEVHFPASAAPPLQWRLPRMSRGRRWHSARKTLGTQRLACSRAAFVRRLQSL